MPGGRPLKFKTPEEMQRRIDIYFAVCRMRQAESTELEKYLVADDLTVEELQAINEITDSFPTVSGLTMALGFATRQSLIHYEEKDEFLDTIKSAKLRVENAIEQRLFYNNATGSIFNLKNNFGWIESQDVNLGGQKDNQLPNAECNTRIAELLNKIGENGAAQTTGAPETPGDQE